MVIIEVKMGFTPPRKQSWDALVGNGVVSNLHNIVNWCHKRFTINLAKQQSCFFAFIHVSNVLLEIQLIFSQMIDNQCLLDVGVVHY